MRFMKKIVLGLLAIASVFSLSLAVKADEVSLFNEVDTKASIRMEYSDKVNKMYLKFGGLVPKSKYNTSAEHGVIILPNDDNRLDDGVTNEELAALMEAGYAQKFNEATIGRLDAEGNEAKNDSDIVNYQFAWVINNIETSNLQELKFNAAMYENINGNITISRVKRSFSLIDAIKATISLKETNEKIDKLLSDYLYEYTNKSIIIEDFEKNPLAYYTCKDSMNMELSAEHVIDGKQSLKINIPDWEAYIYFRVDRNKLLKYIDSCGSVVINMFSTGKNTHKMWANAVSLPDLAPGANKIVLSNETFKQIINNDEAAYNSDNKTYAKGMVTFFINSEVPLNEAMSIYLDSFIGENKAYLEGSNDIILDFENNKDLEKLNVIEAVKQISNIKACYGSSSALLNNVGGYPQFNLDLDFLINMLGEKKYLRFDFYINSTYSKRYVEIKCGNKSNVYDTNRWITIEIATEELKAFKSKGQKELNLVIGNSISDGYDTGLELYIDSFRAIN